MGSTDSVDILIYVMPDCDFQHDLSADFKCILSLYTMAVLNELFGENIVGCNCSIS